MLPLSRPHEQVIFLLYAALGSFGVATCQYNILSHKHLDVTLTFLWLGFLLAISCLEAWVKFKAPFLRKHVAVDIGRYVFAALHAVELALVSAFWLGRLVLVPAAAAGSGRRSSSSNPLAPTATGVDVAAGAGPWMVATTCLVLMILVVAPRLYLRAKFQIVDAMRDVDRNYWTDREEVMLQKIVKDISHPAASSSSRPPSAKWHTVYIVLEVVKIGSLITFLIRMI